ncbi:MAG TPA: Ig-like domain-containing protein [Clostridia bacterium]|nr:Ig-like domain-containing protein [Clostridia bacterium]
MKRIFLALLALVLLFGCFFCASAEGEAQTGSLKALTLNRTKATITLKKGDEFPVQLSLSAKIKPADAGVMLKWQSSNEAVATVDENGLVTAVGFGTTFLTVSENDSGGKSASCVLTVKKTMVGRVRFSKDTYTISIAAGESFGKALQLTPEVAPKDAFDQSLTFASSDEAVAKVDENGLVTSVGYGTAVITATANDGSGKVARCTVKITPVLISAISFVNKSETISVGEGGILGEQLQLKAKVMPLEAANASLTWASSDNEVATVDENGLVTSVGYGAAVITATANDGSGKAASLTVNIAYVAVEKITLNTSKLSLDGGESYLLISGVLPANAAHKDIKWQSSDPAVASVDQKGIVEAHLKGTAKIYAVATDGSQVVGMCTVKVLSDAAVKEDGEPVADPIFSGNVYNLYTPLGADVEQVLRAYYNTLGTGRNVRIIKKALEYAGVGYAYVDCSKLAKIAYKAGGYTIPRVSDDQAYALRNRAIDRSKLKPGDLIFFKKLPNELCSCGTVCRRYQEIHHVGIYFGYVDGHHYIIDASSVIGKIVIRQWDASDSFAEMLYAFSAHR